MIKDTEAKLKVKVIEHIEASFSFKKNTWKKKKDMHIRCNMVHMKTKEQ